MVHFAFDCRDWKMLHWSVHPCTRLMQHPNVRARAIMDNDSGQTMVYLGNSLMRFMAFQMDFGIAKYEVKHLKYLEDY